MADWSPHHKFSIQDLHVLTRNLLLLNLHFFVEGLQAIILDWWSSEASVRSSRIWVPTLSFAWHSIEACRGRPFLPVGWGKTVQTVIFLFHSFDTVLFVKLKVSSGRTSLGLSNAWLTVSFGGVLAAQCAEKCAPLPTPKQSAGKTEHKSVVL